MGLTKLPIVSALYIYFLCCRALCDFANDRSYRYYIHGFSSLIPLHFKLHLLDFTDFVFPVFFPDKTAYSSELLCAAEILIEIASSSESIMAAKHATGRLSWPKAPSMKTMKARKSSVSLDKSEGSFPSAGQNDLIKQVNLPSAKHQPTSERKTNFIRPCSSSGREAVRWSSIPISTASPPHKLDKNLRLPHGNSTFRPLLAPFSSRSDRAYDNQIRKAPAKPSSVAFEGSSIRDWIRGKNKRL